MRKGSMLAGWSRAIAILGCCLGLSGMGCSSDEARGDPGAVQLLANVRADHYQEWARPAGWEMRRQGVSLHGDQVDIFFNSTMANASNQPGLSEWPVGSQIVKNGYRAAEFTLIAVMEKRDSGWFFAEYTAAGKVRTSGRPDACVTCHSDAHDLIYSARLP